MFPNTEPADKYHVTRLQEIIKEKQEYINNLSPRSTSYSTPVTIDLKLMPKFFGDSDMERLERTIFYIEQGYYIIDTRNDD